MKDYSSDRDIKSKCGISEILQCEKQYMKMKRDKK